VPAEPPVPPELDELLGAVLEDEPPPLLLDVVVLSPPDPVELGPTSTSSPQAVTALAAATMAK